MTRMSFFLIIILLASCKLQEPTLPTWDTSWQIELQPDVIRITDILDSDQIISDSLDYKNNERTFFINISDTSEKQQISTSDLSLKTSSQRFSNELGVFNIGKPEAQRIAGKSFSELFTHLNPQPGMALPAIEPFVIEPQPSEVIFDNFQQVDIVDAQLSLIFHNNMIVQIGKNLRIVIYDKSKLDTPEKGVIDTILFDKKIPPHSSIESQQIDLSGKTISNQLKLEYYIPISGTDSMMILSQDDIDSYFYSELVMSAIKVDAALAIVPEQSIIRQNTAPVDADDHTIQKANIKEGTIHLQIENQMNVDTDFEIELPNFTDEMSKVLVINDFVAANKRKNIAVKLNGYSFQNENDDGSVVEKIHYTMSASTRATDDYVWVRSDDSVTVTAVFDTFFFDFLQGEIARTEIEFDPVRTNLLDFNDFEGNFRLPELVLTFNFHNEINYEINLQMQVKSYKYDSNDVKDSVVINMDHLIKSSDTNAGRIVLDKQTSTPSIVDLMSILPDEIIITGMAVIEGPGSVKSGDGVWLDYTIDSPFVLKIDEPIKLDSDIQVISEKDIDGEKRTKIAENLTEVFIKMTTENGLPIGSVFNFYVSTDSTNLFTDTITDSTEKFIIQNQIVAAKTDQTGYVSEPVNSQHQITLTKKQISLFEQSPLYYGFKVSLDPTDEPVRFRTGDQLIYQPVLSFNVLMDPDNF